MQDFSTRGHGLEQRTGDRQHSWKSPVLPPVRSRQDSWDARELRTATTKVRREVYDTFRKLCQEQGETPYSVLRDFLLAFVEYFGGGGEAAEDKPFTGWHTTD